MLLDLLYEKQMKNLLL